MKLAFVTDSGTGKSIQELKEKGIFSVPLQIGYNNKTYDELEEISIDEAYGYMKDGAMLTTSLPALGKIEELFEQIKNDGYDGIFAVPICSGLSGTISAMELCAKNIGLTFDYVDTCVTAVVQEYLVEKAKELFEKNKTIEEIKLFCQKVIDHTNTVLLPDNLKHLARGGRLTPMAATLGGLLKIKPILHINASTNGRIDVVDKVRTMNRAMDRVISIMKSDIKDEIYDIYVAHVDAEEGAIVYRDKIKAVLPQVRVHVIKLVSCVGIHTGRGCQAVQYFKRFDD